MPTALPCGTRLIDFPFRLDRREPLAPRLADGDVLHLTQYVAAIAVAQPADLWQEQAAVGLVELDLPRVRIAQAVAPTLLPEARETGSPGKKVGIGPPQVLERLLQRVNRRSGQPCGFSTVAPLGEPLAQSGVAQVFLALLVAFLLQCQRLVEHKPARTGEAAHLPLLLAVRAQRKFVGLQSLHGAIILLVHEI